MPRHLESEFSSNLKAKSLSTSEIFRPGLSRSPSLISSSQTGLLDIPLDPNRRPASYHGSCESLTGRLEADFADNPDDGALYHCPCGENCKGRVKSSRVMQHIQECHEGPLVHYFKRRIVFPLPHTLGNGVLIAIAKDGTTFFLKVLELDSGEVMVWLWLFGSQKAADNYHLSLKFTGQNGKELCFRSPAVSLAAASWIEVIETKTAVVTLTSDNLRTLCGLQGLRMEVEVKDGPLDDAQQHL